MKIVVTTLVFLTLAAAGCSKIADTTHSPPEAPAKPSDVAISQPNRYKFYSSGNGQWPREFLLDTQTGRMWQYTMDQEKNVFVMSPVAFESLDKKLSLIPNETSTEVLIGKTETTRKIRRAPTPEELEYLRQKGYDISNLPPVLDFEEPIKSEQKPQPSTTGHGEELKLSYPK
jgi:hypothetical protein